VGAEDSRPDLFIGDEPAAQQEAQLVLQKADVVALDAFGKIATLEFHK
jgi:hypothetical protein